MWLPIYSKWQIDRARYRSVIGTLGLLLDKEYKIMAALDGIASKVDALKTAIDTAVGVIAALKASQADPAQVAAVEAAIDSATATLVAATQ